MKKSQLKPNKNSFGIYIALTIILLWLAGLSRGLVTPINFYNPLSYLLILLQTHLSTGLFITAHDAMHGSISPGKQKINTLIGSFCTALYAFFPFQKLFEAHHKHHRHVHTNEDPDFHEGGFGIWYFNFIKTYLSIWQILFFAVFFNLGKLYFPAENLIAFWIFPALLSTFQLFYFGTYLPHKGEHENPHQSRSQTKNHLWAFISCYFFGYHYEHHDAPYIPWWQLWKTK